jgi:hypothetical protein
MAGLAANRAIVWVNAQQGLNLSPQGLESPQARSKNASRSAADFAWRSQMLVHRPAEKAAKSLK